MIGAGRVAVVTGAASGIGRALAEAFAAAGSAVVLADLDGHEAEAVGERLRGNGADAVAVISSTYPIRHRSTRWPKATLDRFGRVDVLCNNAGVSTFNLIQDQTLDDWRWVFNVNMWGVVHGLMSFLPILRGQQTPSHIVNTASMGGLMSGVPFIGPYGAVEDRGRIDLRDASAGMRGIRIADRCERALPEHDRHACDGVRTRAPAGAGRRAAHRRRRSHARGDQEHVHRGRVAALLRLTSPSARWRRSSPESSGSSPMVGSDRSSKLASQKRSPLPGRGTRVDSPVVGGSRLKAMAVLLTIGESHG